MAPTTSNISLDPALAVSKFLSSQPRISQEDPRVIAERKKQQELEKKKQAQKAVSTVITKGITSGAGINAPVVPNVVKTPVQQTNRSMEIPKQPMPEGMPLIAGNVSQESLQPQKLSPQEFARKIKDKYPSYEGIADDVLVDKIISKYPTYVDKVDYDLGRQFTQTPVPVAPQISYGENKIDLLNQQAPAQGGLRRGVSELSTDMGGWEWLNPVGQLTTLINSAAQKIPTIDISRGVKQKVDQKVANLPQQKKTELTNKFNNSKALQVQFGTPENYIREKTKSLGEFFTEKNTSTPNMILNIPGSFIKTLTATAQGIANPVDTAEGLVRLVGTDEGNQVLKDRYGSVEAFYRSAEQDPVGVASDILTIVQGGASLAGGTAKLASAGAKSAGYAGTAGKLASFADDAARLSAQAGGAADLGLGVGMNKLNTGIGNIASKPLRIAAKTALAPTQPLTALSDTMGGVSKQGINQTITRDFPISRIEKDLGLTPTERMKVENTGITAGQFMLEKGLGGSPKEVQINKLQELADNSYNTITSQLKDINSKNISTDAVKMLETMVDEMESSKILKREKSDYINKLKQLVEQKQYTPSELLAIRRDFDKIVGYQLFDSKGRVSGAEDSVIANWRSGLSDQIQKIGEDNGIDIKDMNTDLRNSIVIRDGLLKRLSQENKNNTFGLQDIGIGAVLSAGEPITATAIIIGKKALENAIPGVSQKLYNLNKSKYEPTNMKRGVTINPRDKSSGFSIAPDTNDSVTNAGVRSIVPLKEGQLKNNPATAMIYPKKPVVNVTEKGVAKKPGTTLDMIKESVLKKPQNPLKTIAQKTETKIEPKNLDNTKLPSKVAQLHEAARTMSKEKFIKEFNTNFKGETFEDMTIGGKGIDKAILGTQLDRLYDGKVKSIDEAISDVWDKANNKIEPKKATVYQELQNIAKKVKEKRFIRDDLFADLGDARADKAYSMVNKTNADIREMYNNGKLSDQDIKDIVRARQANAQLDYNERGTVRSNEQNQSLLNLIKEKSLAKKENGSIMDGMKTTISDQIKEAKASGKTFEEFVESKGKSLYHGSKADFDEFDLGKIPDTEKGTFGRGIYVTADESIASSYGRPSEGGKVIKTILDKDTKLADWDTKLGADQVKSLKNTIQKDLGVSKDTIDHIFSIPAKPINLYHRIQEIAETTPKKVSDLFVKSGIDGISVKKKGSDAFEQVSVFNPEKIKTEAQLKAERDKLSPKSDAPVIPKDLKPLYDEAKKYKSADDMINGLEKSGKITYHGTDTDFSEFDIRKAGSSTKAESAKKAIFFTDDRSIAKGYGEYASERKMRDLYDEVDKLQKRGKRDDASDLEAEAERLSALPYKEPVVKKAYIDSNNIFEYDAKGAGFLETDKKVNDLIDKAKKEGKDVLIIKNLVDNVYTNASKSSNHTIVLNPKVIKTESQLRKIREEANKKQTPEFLKKISKK